MSEIYPYDFYSFEGGRRMQDEEYRNSVTD